MSSEIKYPCSDCKEPTKKFAGFMDGHDKNDNPTHGILYTCDNKSCEHFKNFDDSDKKAATIAENLKNGVDAKILKNKLHTSHNTYGSVANILGVGPAQISKWMNEHEPIPKNVYDKLMHLLSK